MVRAEIGEGVSAARKGCVQYEPVVDRSNALRDAWLFGTPLSAILGFCFSAGSDHISLGALLCPLFSAQSALPPSPAMPLSSLADIELRLVSQCLSGHDLLSFARCSRRMFHAADDPFAWAHSPVDVHTDQLELLPESRLLRHAPIALVWISHLFRLSDLQPQLRPSQRIVSIDTRLATRLEWNFWLILDDPCFLGLTTVRMHTESNSNRQALTPDMMRALCALPLLHTLSILHLIGYPGPNQECWSMLPRCASLTDLSVCDGHEQRQELPRHAHVAHCLRLRRLHMLYPLLYGSAFLRFFGSASLSGLEALTIDLFRCRGNGYQQSTVPAEEYRASFAALSHLRSLDLVRCDSIDALLPALSVAPSLRRVLVQPSYCDWFEPEVSAVGAPCGGVPSAAVLAALLSAAPQLSVLLVLRSDTGAKPNARPYKPAAVEVQRVRKLWAQCVHEPRLKRGGLAARFQVAVRFGPLDSAADGPPPMSELDACTMQ